MATAAPTRFAVEEIKPLIGSRVLADKATLLSGDFAAEIRDLLEQRGVLVFPEIHFDDDEQIAFTRTLGNFNETENLYKITLDKSVTATADYLKATIFWHFDGFSAEMPIRASLLSSKVLSETGGNTEFANTYAAYDALSDADKALLEGKLASHSVASTQLDTDPQPSYEEWQRWLQMGTKNLPIVWNHESGRKSLLLGNSAHHVVGMDPIEGKGLLIRLRDWATQEQFVYSHSWTVGDLVMWDNTGSLHRAIPYEVNSKRMLHRTKLEGEEPIV